MPQSRQPVATGPRRAFVIEDDRGIYATASRAGQGYRLHMPTHRIGAPLDALRTVHVSRAGLRAILRNGAKITRRV